MCPCRGFSVAGETDWIGIEPWCCAACRANNGASGYRHRGRDKTIKLHAVKVPLEYAGACRFAGKSSKARASHQPWRGRSIHNQFGRSVGHNGASGIPRPEVRGCYGGLSGKEAPPEVHAGARGAPRMARFATALMDTPALMPALGHTHTAACPSLPQAMATSLACEVRLGVLGVLRVVVTLRDT